jgi:NAD(P)H-hydrate epimerase
VRLAVPASIYPIVGAAELRATCLPLPERSAGELGEAAEGLLLSAIADSDVVAIGPGLGGHEATRRLLQRLVPAVDKPLVLDADGLNAFAGEPARIAGPRPVTFLTPHPGELARLTGRRCGRDDESRRVAAIDLAMRSGGTVILKGQRSVISDGLDVHFNSTGNPGMATGGSGDVLTGCLAALCCRLSEPMKAARLAAWVHGHAGDRAARRLGENGLTATDLLDELAAATEVCVGEDEGAS